MTQRLLIFGAIIIMIGLSGAVWLAGLPGGPWRERSETWGPSLAGACGGMMPSRGPGGMRSGMGPGGMMGGGPMGPQRPGDVTSNGERIYATGMSDRTDPIPRVDGPMWIRMMGGGCLACHGADGRGGRPVMMGTAVPADIRYEALITGAYEPGEQATPYTDALIRRGVTQGLDADGKPLDRTMPRWQMADADVADLLAYLQALR
jgi:mono/diheme cytochrome c family protein